MSENKNRLSRNLMTAFRLVVSLGALIYLIAVLDWQRLPYILVHLKLQYLWLAPILLLFSFYCLGFRWSILLNYFGIQLAKRESFIYYLVGGFYNILLPGAMSGDVVRVGICSVKKHKPITIIATTALLERLFGLFVVLILGAVGTLFLSDKLRQQMGTTLVTTILSVCAVTLLTMISLWLLMRLIPSTWLKFNPPRLRIVFRLVNIFNQLRQIPLSIILATAGFSALAQLSDILASYLLAKTVLIDLPLLIFVVVIAIVYISTALPISLGGLGVREGVLVFLLARFGIHPSDAVTFSFVLYLNRVFIALIGGLIQVFWNLSPDKE